MLICHAPTASDPARLSDPVVVMEPAETAPATSYQKVEIIKQRQDEVHIYTDRHTDRQTEQIQKQ